jgi:hypothetical protein
VRRIEPDGAGGVDEARDLADLRRRLWHAFNQHGRTLLIYGAQVDALASAASQRQVADRAGQRTAGSRRIDSARFQRS